MNGKRMEVYQQTKTANKFSLERQATRLSPREKKKKKKNETNAKHTSVGLKEEEEETKSVSV